MHPQITAAFCDFSDKDEVRAASGAGEFCKTLTNGPAESFHYAEMLLWLPK
jgi:hypothetical protein